MKTPGTEHLVDAYNRMMERVKGALDLAEHEALPNLQRSIDQAKERAVDLGEVTLEEAEHIAQWLRRDLDDAGYYLASSGSELRQWLRFDIEMVEQRLLDFFAKAADQSRLEYLDFENRISAESNYRTGEVTSPGTLCCEHCGKVIHFQRNGSHPTVPWMSPNPLPEADERCPTRRRCRSLYRARGGHAPRCRQRTRRPATAAIISDESSRAGQ